MNHKEMLLVIIKILIQNLIKYVLTKIHQNSNKENKK